MIKATLDQWNALRAVVEEGGYAKAAERLEKSQSTVSYAIATLEERLGIRLLKIQGRRAVLTDAGQLMYRRARQLLNEAGDLEQLARQLSRGLEAEIRLATEVIVPMNPIFDALARFQENCGATRVELFESVLSGTQELLTRGQVDLAITGFLPAGFVSQPLIDIELLAVAHPDHPLIQNGQALTLADLKNHRQLVIRDSGTARSIDAGWLGAEKRWTVSSINTSVDAVTQGLGFAWLPRHRIAHRLESGQLKAIPLQEGGQRHVSIQLVTADADHAGPGTRRLAQCIKDAFAALSP